MPIDIRGNNPQLRILFRRDGHIKLDGTQDAGGGKQADIPVEQPVEGDLPPLFGEDEGPKLAGFDQQQAGTVRAAVVEQGPLFHASADQAGGNRLLLLGRHVVPYGKVL